ncbi:MAG: hypothetical protein R3E08_09020 [Thiotrichaceae bacterium]
MDILYLLDSYFAHHRCINRFSSFKGTILLNLMIWKGPAHEILMDDDSQHNEH